MMKSVSLFGLKTNVNITQMRIAPRPNLFEIGLHAADELEAIHRDEHWPAIVSYPAFTVPQAARAG